MRPKIVTTVAVLVLISAALVYISNTRDVHTTQETADMIGATKTIDSVDAPTEIPSSSANPSPSGGSPRSNGSLNRLFLAETTANPLIVDVPDSELDEDIIDPILSARPIAAYRIVRIDIDILRVRIREVADKPEFKIRLLDEEPMTLIANYAGESSDGWQSGIGSWTGSVVGDETSRASFVVAPDSTMNGVIRTLETGRVKIEPIKGSSHHIIWQWDPNYERNLD